MSVIVRGNLADDAVSVSVSLQLFTKKYVGLDIKAKTWLI